MRLNIAARFTGVQLVLGGLPEPVVLVVASARDVAARPLVLLGRDLPGRELLHEELGILAQACLTMACVFCRGALIAVWKTKRRRLPSLTRMPSAPRRQPAASRTWFALSMLNSHRVFLDCKRGGAFTRRRRP
jgi:hypothetical protein